MRITEREDEGVRCVELEGRFDAHEVPRVGPSLEPHPGGVVIDLASVHFVDSSALAALVTATKRASAAGTPFRIRGIRDEVRLIFEVTGLLEVLPLDTP